MHHPYEGDTRILIDIQADNRAEILQCVQESFEYMPGWSFGDAASNAKVNHPEERIFVFNLSLHTFDWWRTNDSLSDTMDGDEVVIKDLAGISHLLEFVWLNGDNLRTKYIVPDYGPPPKKKRKKDDDEVYELSSAFEKFFNTPPKTTPEKAFNAMEFIKIQPMNQPKASVFYKDLAKTKDLTSEQYDTYYDKAYYANCEGELIGLYNKTVGLHGPLATKLGHFIDQKIKNLKYQPQNKSFGYEAELHDAMAKKYEEYLYTMQKKKAESWYDDYPKSKASFGQKWWNNEGIMIKPYTYMHTSDSMDY